MHICPVFINEEDIMILAITIIFTVLAAYYGYAANMVSFWEYIIYASLVLPVLLYNRNKVYLINYLISYICFCLLRFPAAIYFSTRTYIEKPITIEQDIVQSIAGLTVLFCMVLYFILLFVICKFKLSKRLSELKTVAEIRSDSTITRIMNTYTFTYAIMVILHISAIYFYKLTTVTANVVITIATITVLCLVFMIVCGYEVNKTCLSRLEEKDESSSGRATDANGIADKEQDSTP